MASATEYMKEAISLAQEGMRSGAGGPFAAIIVKGDKVVGRAHNETFLRCDPTAHAEVQAIRAACRELGSLELAGCDMYTTGEPCPMCMAAIYWSMIDNVYFANTKEQAALCGFDDSKIYRELSKEWKARALNMAHLPSDEAVGIFNEWMEKMKEQTSDFHAKAAKGQGAQKPKKPMLSHRRSAQYLPHCHITTLPHLHSVA